MSTRQVAFERLDEYALLKARFGPLAYLTREITREIPALMHELRAPNRF